MVHDIVRREPHAIEGTGGVEVARHTATTIDILPYTLSTKQHNI